METNVSYSLTTSFKPILTKVIYAAVEKVEGKKVANAASISPLQQYAKQGPAGQRCVRMALKRHKGIKKA